MQIVYVELWGWVIWAIELYIVHILMKLVSILAPKSKQNRLANPLVHTERNSIQYSGENPSSKDIFKVDRIRKFL